MQANDALSFKDKHDKQGLRGHVQIFRENRTTGEKALWYEDDNIISISGMQWILMKMFGLYLDSSHNKEYENIGRDTNLVMPDLNSAGNFKIGIDPESYSTMEEDISDAHYIQGFMVGNGGSGEDAITTKNTDYSFIKLRNPIPFQQTQTSLNSSIAGQYLGNMREGSNSFSKNYYIKKFDSRPHIYHSWYSEGQAWDYVDPVSANDLGPNPVNGAGKTNRIETYVQCEMSVDTLNSDCKSYFEHEGSTQTALINELGLCAWDAEYGDIAILEALHDKQIKDILAIIFDNDRDDPDKGIENPAASVIALANEIYEVCEGLSGGPLSGYECSNIQNFISLMADIKMMSEVDVASKWTEFQETLSEVDDTEAHNPVNIGVEALYNQSQKFIYTTDKFLEFLSTSVYDTLTNDEAQRIRLVTYYTFKSIPLDDNWKITILYRIYAN